MEASRGYSSPLFDVYLRLRPNSNPTAERFLDGDNTHVTIKPPTSDHRKRAVERFAFTKVFDESTSQRDVFDGTSLLQLIQGVLGAEGKVAKDGLLATLGVTGSGKSHTILGTRSQRGLAQMSLSVLLNSMKGRIVDPMFSVHELAAVDVSEAYLVPAINFLDSIYGDLESRAGSRAQTPLMVSNNNLPKTDPLKKSHSDFWHAPRVPGAWPSREHDSGMLNSPVEEKQIPNGARNQPSVKSEKGTIRPVTGFARITRSVIKLTPSPTKEMNSNTVNYPALPPNPGLRRGMPRPTIVAQQPSVDDLHISCDQASEYALLLSMYEVYNDRIFDLLSGSISNSKKNAKDARRRPLLFKSTEYSPDRKIVAGLKKIVCGNLEEALMVLETGLLERTVAGTGSNAVSSRSHGFFCVEVKRKNPGNGGFWTGNSLTVVDLAGSERARAANTAGSTLAEAGKINESLMYLGQCMQMQSDNSSFEAVQGQQADESLHSTSAVQDTPANLPKPGLVPFRQCKLTELLFSNAFHHHSSLRSRRHPQKAIMIVTADPHGDFNATSQILRYSALAREVTVPRIPSVTSTILAQQAPSGAVSSNSRPTTACSNCSFHSQPTTATLIDSDEENMRNASASMAAEIALLRHRLGEETQRRLDAEASWARAEQRLEEAEGAVRQECWDAFEGRMDTERERWKAAWEEERCAGERMVDEKLGLLMRQDEENSAVDVHEDSMEIRLEDMERENNLLREKVKGMTRERDNDSRRTPSRKLKGLKGKKWVADEEDLSCEDRENRDAHF